jgi:hypothetical protein
MGGVGGRGGNKSSENNETLRSLACRIGGRSKSGWVQSTKFGDGIPLTEERAEVANEESRLGEFTDLTAYARLQTPDSKRELGD